MTIHIATASPWTVRAAYFSAAIFIAGSGTTNVTYGCSKGDTLATSLVWAGVVFALSWPALIRSVDADFACGPAPRRVRCKVVCTGIEHNASTN